MTQLQGAEAGIKKKYPNLRSPGVNISEILKNQYSAGLPFTPLNDAEPLTIKVAIANDKIFKKLTPFISALAFFTFSDKDTIKAHVLRDQLLLKPFSRYSYEPKLLNSNLYLQYINLKLGNREMNAILAMSFLMRIKYAYLGCTFPLHYSCYQISHAVYELLYWGLQSAANCQILGEK